MSNNNNEWTTVGAKKPIVKTVNRFINQAVQDNKPVKTVYATGPKYYSDTDKCVRIEIASNKTSVQSVPVQKTMTKKELMQEKDKLLNEALNEIENNYSEKTIEKMLDDHFNNKVYDHKIRSYATHLKLPIILSYYNKNNVNRYATLSSVKFQDSVTEYFNKYDLNVSFSNDADNEIWRIFLYPQD